MSAIVLTSETLIGTPAPGNIEYNGQFFGTDSAGSRAQLQRMVRATAVTSTTGTAIDFANIPAWVERITVIFQNVSLSATANILVQLGTGSTTYTTTGYTSISVACQSGGNSVNSSTAGFVMINGQAARVVSGHMTITNISGNNWISSHTGKIDASASPIFGAGDISLSAVLTAVRITTNSTDTFDAGSVNIIYEG
jgi:hypothetical protein